MSVLHKEYYTQKNGTEIIKVILKSTKVFPEGGYFYCPREAESLVDGYTWFLDKNGKNKVVVMARICNGGTNKTLYFHKELFRFYQGYDYQEDIDHISLVEIDNTDNNLNAVTRQQNSFNTYSKGYFYRKRDKYFQAQYKLNDKVYLPFSVTYKEDEACKQANEIDKVILKEELGDQYYKFDFLKYRRDSKDILDLERTGKITEQEATYRHILKYSNNAWYYLRFGLQEYFKQNNIPVPEYSLDEQGFMVDVITRQKLCPFYKD